jgi:hypothetical protein
VTPQEYKGLQRRLPTLVLHPNSLDPMKKTILDALLRALPPSVPAVILCFAAGASVAQDGQTAAESQAAVASPILSVVFDDPNQLFSAYPDGISLLDVRNDSGIQEKTVATGMGGSGKIEIRGESEEGAGEPPKTFVLLSSPDEGIKSALRITADKTVPGISAVIRIKPETEETSMASISTFKDGKIFLNGGIDFFLRYSEEPPPSDLVPFVFSSQGPGLHFGIHAHDQSIVAFLNDSEGQQVFDTDLDGAGDAERVDTIKVNSAQLDPQKFQHLAIWFQTAEDGTVTMKVFFKGGPGPINTAEDVDLLSTASFRIITDQPGKLLESGSVAIGANSRANPEIIQNDIAAFRLFAPTPAIFPSLAGGM